MTNSGSCGSLFVWNQIHFSCFAFFFEPTIKENGLRMTRIHLLKSSFKLLISNFQGYLNLKWPLFAILPTVWYFLPSLKWCHWAKTNEYWFLSCTAFTLNNSTGQNMNVRPLCTNHVICIFAKLTYTRKCKFCSVVFSWHK